jgi:hypothetical protein
MKPYLKFEVLKMIPNYYKRKYSKSIIFKPKNLHK